MPEYRKYRNTGNTEIPEYRDFPVFRTGIRRLAGPRIPNSGLTIPDSGLRDPDSGLRKPIPGRQGLRTSAVKLRTMDPRIRTEESKLQTDDPIFRTEDPKLRTDDLRIRTEDSKLRTDDLRFRTEYPRFRTGLRTGVRSGLADSGLRPPVRYLEKIPDSGLAEFSELRTGSVLQIADSVLQSAIWSPQRTPDWDQKIELRTGSVLR